MQSAWTNHLCGSPCHRQYAAGLSLAMALCRTDASSCISRTSTARDKTKFAKGEQVRASFGWGWMYRGGERRALKPDALRQRWGAADIEQQSGSKSCRRRRLADFGLLGAIVFALAMGTMVAHMEAQEVPHAPAARVGLSGLSALSMGRGANSAARRVVGVAAKNDAEKRAGGSGTHTPARAPSRAATAAPDLHYHWRGLLLQTIEFNVIENSWRLASDSGMRDQISHKPYWHDYVTSLKQWNMRRWNDGDDFLVNYVGHPMQGAVSSFIEIQNSPVDSRIRWGGEGYAKSRFKGFLWAIVFSTYEKVGPTGESGVGNNGGFTYGTKCFELCRPGVNFLPGDHYTNNTGWVDFIITPTVGMLWVFAEDFLDKDVSSRIPNSGRTHNASRIVHGALNPSRTFANFLRWRNPWYRDWDHPIGTPVGGVHFLKSDDPPIHGKGRPRFEISPHLTGFSIATNRASCYNCRTMTTGAGVEASMRLLPWLDADVDMSYQPNASPLPSDRAGGNMLAGFFGLRTGVETENYALKVAVRPGFVRFDHAYQTSPTSVILQNNGLGPVSQLPGMEVQNPPPTLGDITHFAWNVNLTGDYKVTGSVAFRAGIGEDLVRYRSNHVDPPGIGEPPYVSWLSKENFINRGNWSYQVGPVFSF
jgi:hypothetical protein